MLENTDDLSLEESMNNVGSAMLSRFPRWFVLSHVEIQQCQLAATLLAAAKSKSSYAHYGQGSGITCNKVICGIDLITMN